MSIVSRSPEHPIFSHASVWRIEVRAKWNTGKEWDHQWLVQSFYIHSMTLDSDTAFPRNMRAQVSIECLWDLRTISL